MKFVLNDYHRSVSDEELLDNLRKIAKQLGKESITIEEYQKGGGKYHPSTIIHRFGGWIHALEMGGLSPSNLQINKRGVNREDLLNDIIRVSKKIGKKTFTHDEYLEFGKYSKSTFQRRFGSWNEALKAAGLNPFERLLGSSKARISEYACLEEIERIWIELGRQPTATDIRKGCSKFSIHAYERRFGSWRKALEFFVSYMNEERELETPVKIVNPKAISEKTQKPDSPIPAHKTKRDISLRMRFIVFKRDDFKCCLCGRSPATTSGLELHVDHILPWSKGGETTIDNLQTLCSDCNLGKGNLS